MIFVHGLVIVVFLWVVLPVLLDAGVAQNFLDLVRMHLEHIVFFAKLCLFIVVVIQALTIICMDDAVELLNLEELKHRRLILRVVFI